MQLSGRAVDGPLNGVMLRAPQTWLGTIKKRTDGRYVWDDKCDTWVWSTRTEQLPQGDDAATIARARADAELARFRRIHATLTDVRYDE